MGLGSPPESHDTLGSLPSIVSLGNEAEDGPDPVEALSVRILSSLGCRRWTSTR